MSLFQWHNETLNIWTHLIGCVLFVGLIIYFSNFYNDCFLVYEQMVTKLRNSNIDFSENLDIINRNLDNFKQNTLEVLNNVENSLKVVLENV